jgi:CubicO group peptidase (beta-lactamase class C family)
MILVEEGRIGLDDPVDGWQPELSERKVLRRLEGPVDDTVPARRPITLRDLMTLRFGIGAVMTPPGTCPVQAAIEAAGLTPSAKPVVMPVDEFMRRLSALPLLHQPGERWMYHTGFDVLAVLLTRLTGRPLGEFLEVRIFAPLGKLRPARRASGEVPILNCKRKGLQRCST